MKKYYLFLVLIFPLNILAQTGPEITSWILNTTGQTGYAGILTNVQQVQYSLNNVYVTATCIPDYTIGPWTNNPNTPVNQNFVFKITRNPAQNFGNQIATPLGHIGLWSNGVSIFNSKDGMSYNNLGIWNRDALIFEGISFDNCLGHAAANGEYHHHVNPSCLYDDTDDSKHAPIIGYAFDGFPIYGAYGFDNANGTGIYRKMQSSYQLRNITNRTTLPDGTILNVNQYGPAIGGQYPLGAFIEDYEYIAGSGDLDIHNGRFCITPEYPNGIYAYFVTIDANEYPVFPYVIGPNYYGTVQAGNTGPNSGHVIVNEPVTTYIPGSTNVIEIKPTPLVVINSGSFSGEMSFTISNNLPDLSTATVYDVNGKIIAHFGTLIPGQTVQISKENISPGIYFLKVKNSSEIFTIKMML